MKLRCPECDSMNARTRDTRYPDDRVYVRRRHACEECGHCWTTYETYDPEWNATPPLQGEGPYRLKLTDDQWQAIADGRAL